MPELGKGVIVGGGFAGLAAAYWFRQHNKEVPLVILEKEDRPLAWMDRKGLEFIPAGDSSGPGEPLAGRYTHGLLEMERLLGAWPGSSSRDWLDSLGFRLDVGTEGSFSFASKSGLREKWCSILLEQGVEIHVGYAVEAISRQPDGSFRIWSREGDPTEARGLLLATGGERNHGLTLSRESGHETVPVEPGYLRLRLAGQKAGSQLAPMTRKVKLKCLKSGLEAIGMVALSARGLEGWAVSCLSAQLAVMWRQLGHRIKIEVDWLPDFSPAQVMREVLARSEQGGRSFIGQEPLFGFSLRQWNFYLKEAKVDAETPWGKTKQRKLQALVQQLKRSLLTIAGSGLPRNERAWSGGIHPASVDWNSGKSLATQGIWFAGEILDFLGMPGGPHVNAVWASAYQAGSSMGLQLRPDR